MAQWNGINAKVSVSKCAFDSSTANEFHVVTGGSGSYGLHTPMGWDPVVGQWYKTDPDSAPWNWSAVYIYHDKMDDDSFTYSERVKTITHEIGHALSLKHPQVENSTANVTGAVMTSGKATTTVTKSLFQNKTNNLMTFILLALAMALLIFNPFETDAHENQSKIPPEVSIESEYPEFQELIRLEEAADIIIIGYTKQNIPERINYAKISTEGKGAIEDFYTKTDITIEKVMKSPTDLSLKEEGSLTVLEPFAFTPRKVSQKLRFDDYFELNKNSKYVLFLQKNRDGQYYIMNRNSGKFNIDGTDDSDRSSQSGNKAKLLLEVKEKYQIN